MNALKSTMLKCSIAKFRRALSVVVLMALLPPSMGVSQSVDELGEYDVKAAFLVNFVRFVEWPATSFASPQSALTICIFGEDSFGEAANSLKSKIVSGHPLSVRRVNDVREVAACHILFVGSADSKQLGIIQNTAAAKSILTVGESAAFQKAGGMIRFVLEDNKVRLEINLGETEAALLKVSAKLLSVAKIIHPQSGRN